MAKRSGGYLFGVASGGGGDEPAPPPLPARNKDKKKFNDGANNNHRRRGGLKQAKVTVIKGHQFVPRYFKKPTYCGHCRKFLYGLKEKGFRCTHCQYSCHAHCAENLTMTCVGADADADDTASQASPLPHNFKPKTFTSPTFCGQCGGMLYGLFRQGLHCKNCKMNCHKKCQAFIPDTCGTDHTERRGRLYVVVDMKEKEGTGMGKTFTVSLTVGKGKNLLAMDSNGYSDPYVKIFLIPDTEKGSEQKSKTHKRTLNPTFNETFHVDISSADMRAGGGSEKRILLHLWDWDRITADDFMGGMSFGAQELFAMYNERAAGGDTSLSLVSGWFKVLSKKQANAWFELAVPDEGDFRSTSVKLSHGLKSTDSHGSAHGVLHHEGGGAVPRRRKSVFEATALESFEKSTAAAAVPAPSAAKKVLATESLTDYNLKKVLGQGSFGKVFLAENKRTKKFYAIKSLQKVNVIENNDVADTITEKQILAIGAEADCQFITGLHATFQDVGHLFFVMEFVSGGDLMFAMADGELSEPTCAFYTAEVLLALWFLHDKGIIYRDLKLDNVMLAADGHVKVADFGMCKQGMGYGEYTSTFCGTPDYLAPEIVKSTPEGYTTSVDFWTLGVLLYEMAQNMSPFEGDTDEELFEHILTAPIEIEPEISRGLKSAILGFLNRNPKERLGCSRSGRKDCEDHIFFKDIDWEKLANKEVTPPMVPKAGTSNFDAEFTSQPAKLTPIPPKMLAQVDQSLFSDFTYLHDAPEVAAAAGGGGGSGGGGGRSATMDRRKKPTLAEKEALMKAATMGKGARMGDRMQTSEEAKRALLKKAMASHQ